MLCDLFHPLGRREFTHFLGQNAIKVVTRLTSLFLAVIGVQMLITGIQGVAWA
ncbi:MAG: MarC family protein [Verrucomicrobiota bacterium]|nr:MarC family protein [Verrucomicrobiota bacterium]